MDTSKLTPRQLEGFNALTLSKAEQEMVKKYNVPVDQQATMLVQKQKDYIELCGLRNERFAAAQARGVCVKASTKTPGVYGFELGMFRGVYAKIEKWALMLGTDHKYYLWMLSCEDARAKGQPLPASLVISPPKVKEVA